MPSRSTHVQFLCGCLLVGLELLGLMVTPHFTLPEAAKLFSKVAAPFFTISPVFLRSHQQDLKVPVWFGI